MGKIEIFACAGCGKSCNVAIAKLKYLCISNFQQE